MSIKITKFRTALLYLFLTISFSGILLLTFSLGTKAYFNISKKHYQNVVIKERNLIHKFTKLSIDFDNQISRAYNESNRIRSIFGVSNVALEEQEVGIGGPPTDADINEYFENVHEKQVSELNKVFKKLNRQAEYDLFRFDKLHKFVIHKQSQMDHIPSIYPTEGIIRSEFGMRLHPILNVRRLHGGIDISNAEGTPIIASADGIVQKVADSESFGYWIMLNHQNGLTTIYAHLQSILVKEGDLISRADLIGTMGSTGRSTGPHLHYEVRRWNRPQNPRKYFTPTEYIFN